MSPLPKLAPGVLSRARIAAWLRGHASMPLRLICAPAGSGKTTAVASYCATASGCVHYYAVGSGDGVEALRAQLARASGASENERVASYEELVRRFADAPPVEIVLDDLHGASRAAMTEVLTFVRDVPSHVRVIATVADPQAAADERLFGAGLAVTLDAARLAFRTDEIGELALALGVAFEQSDAEALYEQSEGWAIVACGAVREAAASGATLRRALENWRAANAAALVRFVQAEGLRRGDEFGIALDRLCSGAELEAPLLRALERRGLFVHPSGAEFTPYRALVGIAEREPSREADAPAGLLTVQMFGRFEAHVAGRPIRWARRRDQQIVQYLLLAPGGRAPRHELQDAFWPQMERFAAARSLRTACSTIRKAIGDATGTANVKRYFSSEGDLAIVLENASVDLRRFDAHLAEGEIEFDRGNLTNAIAHFGAAEKLSNEGLLSGEVIDPALEDRVRAYTSLREHLLERLARAWFEASNRDMARVYAKRILAVHPNHREMQRLVVALERRADPLPSIGTYEEHVARVAVDRPPSVLAS